MMILRLLGVGVGVSHFPVASDSFSWLSADAGVSFFSVDAIFLRKGCLSIILN